jgi:hypothetical protein
MEDESSMLHGHLIETTMAQVPLATCWNMIKGLIVDINKTSIMSSTQIWPSFMSHFLNHYTTIVQAWFDYYYEFNSGKTKSSKSTMVQA